jgi:iron complex transport system permease protein
MTAILARTRLAGALAALVALLVVAGLLVGPAGLGLPASGEAARLILWEIRMPRAILGALVGAALGLSGAVLQGYLRNPLAEPAIIGVSSGASLGAVVMLHTGLAAAMPLALPLGGLAGAAITTLAVLMLAGERESSVTLILAGVAVGSVATALTTLALNLSPNPFAAVEIVYWLMGSLSDRSLTHVWIAAPFILAGLVLMLRLGRALDALTLGEDAATNLGIDLGRLRYQVVAGVALAVGTAAAIAGTIGFVGLIVPHLLRPLVGAEPGRLLPTSMLGGAAMVLTADLALRILAPYSDVKLGVLTALIGAPFFVWLVIRTRRELTP